MTPLLPLHVQLAIYLDWISHYPTIRKQKQFFKLSHDRIECARDSIRVAIMKIVYPQYVRDKDSIPDLSSNSKMKFFQGAYGCIDGNYIVRKI